MADYLQAEFDGTAGTNLAAYTPEINTLSVPAHPLDGPGNEDTFAANPGLTLFKLDGAGAVQLDMTNASQDQVMSLVSGAEIAEADYAVEIELELPSFADAAFGYNLYLALGGRMWLDAFDQWNTMMAWFTVQYHTSLNKIFVSPRLVSDGNDTGDIYIVDDNFGYDSIDLGTAAQTLKLRVEFEGRNARIFVNDQPQEVTQYDPDSGANLGTKDVNVEWQGTSLDAAGKAGLVIQFQNDANEGSGLSTAKLGRMVVTDTFITVGPGSPFWTNYVLTREVLS